MKVARVMRPREIRFDDASIPSPGPGEALVRIRAVGICGSDLQYYAQGRIGELAFTPGHILGHEVAGVIEALGPGTDQPRPGTLVAVDPAIHCGACRYCTAGHPNLCRNLRFFGSPPTPGALQEYMVHPAHLLYPIARPVSPSVVATLEPLGVAIHAIDLAHLSLGDSVAVFGCGPIGLLASRVARLAGAGSVFASEPLGHRREVARSFGVDTVLDPTCDNVVNDILDRTNGEGVDVALEIAGSQEATDQAVEAVRPGGTVILVGYWKADHVELRGIRAMRKGLTLRFVRRMKHTFSRAMALHDQGLVDLAKLITHEFPFEDLSSAFALAEQRSQGAIKVVVCL